MAQFHCPSCSHRLHASLLGGVSGDVTCPRCSKPFHARLFSSLLESDQPKPPTLPDPPAEGEASCFYNPERRATSECKHCGVLISQLWAAHWGEDVVCLKCLDHLRTQGKDERFETGRTLWDNVVLVLAGWPLVLPLVLVGYCFVPISAAAAFILGLWHWRSPRSLVSPGRWRLVVGLLLAFIQLGVVSVGGYFMYEEITKDISKSSRSAPAQP